MIGQIFLVCSVNVSGGLSDCVHSTRHEDCPHLSCDGDFSEVYVKLCSFSLRAFKKKTVLVS